MVPFFARIAASFALGAALTTLPVPSGAQESVEEREVHFLTIRNRTGEDDAGLVFGDDRSDLKAGSCIVRGTDFDIFTPLAEAAPAYIREEFLRLSEVRLAEPEAVLDSLRPPVGERAPLMYVHGFNISFEKGCRRASLLQENIGTQDQFVWFSWPSDGSLTDYMSDESDLYWSVPDIAGAILEMSRRFGAEGVNVLGHSLGGRGVVLALSEVAIQRPSTRLGDVVLLAPDMDFEIFVRFLPRISTIARSITIYVSSDDRPLTLSAQLHGYQRLGQAGNPVAMLDGVEVIDVSNAPSSSPTGHLYHLYSPEVGSDLSQLLNEGKSADERSGLVRGGMNLWRLTGE